MRAMSIGDGQRPALSSRLRALSALEARGEIDALQKGNLKDALLSSPETAGGLGEVLDRYHASGGNDRGGDGDRVCGGPARGMLAAAGFVRCTVHGLLRSGLRPCGAP